MVKQPLQEEYGGSTPTSPLQFLTGRHVSADDLLLRYHYSGRLPNPPSLVCRWQLGENVVAAAYFSIPPTRWNKRVLELIRLVRHPSLDEPLTRFLSCCVSSIRKNLPKEDLLVSNADSTYGHFGGIYQAASWNFHILKKPSRDGFIIDEKFFPRRYCYDLWGTSSSTKLRELLPDKHIEDHWDKGKYLYWKSLTRSGKQKAKQLKLETNPYPKPWILHHSFKGYKL